MLRVFKLILLALVLLLLLAQLSGAQTQRPSFSESDRAAINAYFKGVHTKTAPGSIDRTELPLPIEQSLVSGGRVPLQYEKRLARLPEALRAQLSLLPGGYESFMLGKHVLLVKRGTLEIADVVRNAGWDK
jgi:hypothetical protein